MRCGKIAEPRLGKIRSLHSSVMSAWESVILGENVPHGKDGEGKRKTRQGKMTRPNV